MMIYGHKEGMTRWIDKENGSITPVTVIKCDPNKISRLLTDGEDGYSAVQVSFGKTKAGKITKPVLGVYKARSQEPAKYLKEFRVAAKDLDKYKVGENLSVTDFNDIDYVDATGITVGKGFAGVIKRHNFKTQDATHGNSLAHRAPGSIGQCQDPGRVFKGKKMAGRMGGVQRTAQSLKLVHVDAERNLLIVAGAVPGHKGGLIKVTVATKKLRGEQ